MIALIPARSGSKRIPGKNTKLLAGHPLIAYTIAAAIESRLFERVIVSTEDDRTAVLAASHGVDVCRRSRRAASDDAPDVSWVRETLEMYPGVLSFAILRPTSPFRTASTIHRASKQFHASEVQSIRAVQPVKEHPGKMWRKLDSGCIAPLLPEKHADGTPWHSSPTQTLPTFYRQNASLEMAWTYVVSSFGTISGNKIAPFFTHGYEGFDINEPADWIEAERIAASQPDALPRVDVATLSASTPAQ